MLPSWAVVSLEVVVGALMLREIRCHYRHRRFLGCGVVALDYCYDVAMSVLLERARTTFSFKSDIIVIIISSMIRESSF